MIILIIWSKGERIIISFHPIEEKWLSDIQQELGYSTLSDKTRNQIARIVAILIKEEYRFSEK